MPNASSRRPATLALLPGEPAGRIPTANAGAVSLSATLHAPPDEPMLPGLFLDDPCPPGAKLFFLDRSLGLSGSCRVSCEVRALRPDLLAVAVDAALRWVADYAALAGAVLETRVVRIADPAVPPAALVEGLARHLWEAGLRVSFGPSWTPSAGADVSIGIGGAGAAFEALLRDHPAWRPRRPSS